MPRLPTILVIGSQAISTMSVVIDVPPPLPGALIAGQQLVALGAPAWLLVGRSPGEPAKGPDDGAVHAGGRGRDFCAGWFVHEWHEFVGEAGHGAGDADAADVGAAADAVDPAAFGDVAFDDRAPAAEFDKAGGRAVFLGELALYVVAGSD